jgi:hypothetical protein
VAERGNHRILPVNVAQIDIPFRQFAHDDVVQAFQPRPVFRGELDHVFLGELNLRAAAFEIKSGREFLPRLIQGIEDFLLINFGDNVKGGHTAMMNSPARVGKSSDEETAIRRHSR